LVPGESAEGQKDGHTVALQYAEVTVEGGTVPAISGAWICDRSERVFAMTYLTVAEVTSEELLVAFEGYLGGLHCH
jgi:hypothetical protein